MSRVLLVDNYDSFTWNLAHLFGGLGAEVVVRRNDAVTPEEAEALAPTHLIVSPGPGRPAEAGVSGALIRHFAGKRPILGVCLGHQCIGEAYGGTVARAEHPLHGKVSRIYHDGAGLFRGLPNPFPATRYHSLLVREEGLPKCLEISAHTSEGEVMGIRHRELPIEGVQFHPESVMTDAGRSIARHFLDL